VNSRRNYLAGQVLWTDLKMGRKTLRIYNCHLAVFGIGMEDRAGMLSDIAKHANKFAGPVVICGDMNTMMPELRPGWWVVKAWARSPYPGPKTSKYTWQGEKYYFYDTARKYGFSEVLGIEDQTWRLPIAKHNLWRAKLDWMLYRDLTPVEHKLGPWIGDHRGIIATLKV
jgi:endonuclease/exonuclease/phosphatase (EEP) superfamily protein YafD